MPNAYRAKWGLPSDYPMVAPNYAARRSTLAKELGLGRKRPMPDDGAPASDAAGRAELTEPAEEKLFPADLADAAKAGRHTAESVFGAFGDGVSAEDDAGEDGEEVAPASEAATPRKRGRKPFAEQSVRTGRKGRTPANS